MAQKLKTEAGEAQYRRRKVIPEPVFGWINTGWDSTASVCVV